MEKLITLNEYGHLLISITSFGLTGSKEIERLDAGGYRLTKEADCVLLNDTHLGYDAKHCLEKGTESKIVLIPNKAIPGVKSGYMIPNSRIEEYALSLKYRIPPAGIAPYLCDKDLYEELSSYDVSYILIFHEPILGDRQYPYRLDTFQPCKIKGSVNPSCPAYVGAMLALPTCESNDLGATAFLAPD